MPSFVDKLRERWAGIAERMSPRARQWTVAALISGGGVGLLWAVFSAGSGDSAQRAAAAAAQSDVRPTNVDLMAPGSQVKDSEVWIGKAGKELESYKAERDEQRRVNRDLNDKQRLGDQHQHPGDGPFRRQRRRTHRRSGEFLHRLGRAEQLQRSAIPVHLELRHHSVPGPRTRPARLPGREEPQVRDHGLVDGR